MSFCLRKNKSFFSLLEDKQNLSLGEFDELKSHPFSVHFSYLFISKKGLIYMQKCGITHQTAMQQEIQNKTGNMFFYLRTNKSFFSLLEDKQNLSLGEFDELKIHPFLVQFFFIDFYLKKD